MEVQEKMQEGSPTLGNVTQTDNKDVKPLQKSAGDTSEVVASATSGGAKPEGGDRGDVVSDRSGVVAGEENGGEEEKRAEKRMKYSEDDGIVGGEPPAPLPNFKIRLFGFEISCYKENQGPRDDEGSSCTTSDPSDHGGCGSSGLGDVGAASGGEPPIQQP
ncbi:hypothetical protein L1987_03976 [Smallanthus sonchifolius]|uniref:Uncharacterized protein n=1 Tax=Smallanthus sonchifolius TaxID=185202 RepID=A0ACB9KC47_9ASTR|nr:hypothetical protein L1987_03976 [Smallanthus sonchifolius]